MTAKVPSLKEWVAEHSQARKPTAFVDRLPTELVDQIRAAASDPNIITRDIVEWLHALGYSEATENKVGKFCTAVRQGRS